MDIVSVASTWSTYIRPAWLASLDATPFLQRCCTGEITRRELNSFVRQQRFYSCHFTRYLSALLANLEGEEDRRELMQNLFEEMGLGSPGGVTHAQMYRDMMRAMDVSLDAEAPLPETEALVATMLECCNSKRPMVGLGALCLGAEAIVPHLYSIVMKGFEAVGEPIENLTFFKVHIEDDDDHAVTMQKIILRELARDPSSRVDLAYGASRAIQARAAFFGALAIPNARAAAAAAAA